MEEATWITSFRQTLIDLDEAIKAYRKSEPTAEEAAANLAALHTAKAEFGLVYDGLASLVIDLMTEPIVLPDGTQIEKSYSKSRRAWQHKSLARVVADRIDQQRLDEETGEIVMSTREAIEAMLKYVSPSAWKVKALREIGVEADNYCEAGDAHPNIIIRKG